jgi:hypothetical protein
MFQFRSTRHSITDIVLIIITKLSKSLVVGVLTRSGLNRIRPNNLFKDRFLVPLGRHFNTDLVIRDHLLFVKVEKNYSKVLSNLITRLVRPKCLEFI